MVVLAAGLGVRVRVDLVYSPAAHGGDGCGIREGARGLCEGEG